MMMRSENEMELGSDRILQPEGVNSTPLPQAPPDHEVRTRRRMPWFTMVVATFAVAAVASAAVLAASRSNLSRDLAATQVALDMTNYRLSTAQTQADGLREQVEHAQSQLEDANAATQDVRTSLAACQDLFRTGMHIGSRPPTSGEATQAVADLTSCFEGKFPPSLFP